MRLETVKSYMRSVSYRPDWLIEPWTFWDSTLGTLGGVRVTMNVINTYHPQDPKMPLSMSQVVPNSVETQEEFFDWLLGILLWMEEHEGQEWFKVDGRPWTDPHSTPYHRYDPIVMTSRARELRLLIPEPISHYSF